MSTKSTAFIPKKNQSVKYIYNCLYKGNRPKKLEFLADMSDRAFSPPPPRP